MTDCVFCRIARGEMAADVVKRSERFVAFRDLNPQAPVHMLVIPTHHVGTLNDASDPAVLGGLLAFTRDLAKAEGIATRGYRVVINTNPDGGQTVFHLHAHVLGGRPLTWPPG